jgi:hypothetical protein
MIMAPTTGIKTTGNSRIDSATAEIATHLRDADLGGTVRIQRTEQSYYDEAMRLRDEILAGAAELAYDPVSGACWNYDAAVAAWSRSMNRCTPRWQLRGKPGAWEWEYWNFSTWHGWVTIMPDGFAWRITDHDTGKPVRHGKTTSLFVAFQSCERNEEVTTPPWTRPS